MSIVNIIIVVILILVLIWGIRNIFFKTNIIYDDMCDAQIPINSASVTTLSNNSKNIILAKDIPENNCPQKKSPLIEQYSRIARTKTIPVFE